MTSPGPTSNASRPAEAKLRRVAWATLLAAVFEARESEAVGRPTPAGLFVPSPLIDIHRLFEMVRLETCRAVADLGSGDGRVVMLASLYAPAVGLEADPALAASARAQALALGLPRASFIVADYLTADLSGYDLLFIYPDKPIDRLLDNLAERYRGRLLVYGPLAASGRRPAQETFRLRLGRAGLFVF